jgi:hypothetical protein
MMRFTTAQCRHYNQPNHTHENLSTGGNSSSPSHTPLFEHTLTHATIGLANTNTLSRLLCSSHETTMTSTQICATHMPHHKAGKQSQSSNGSHGQGHGQAPQLKATNEQPKILKSMEPVSSQRIWAIGKWHRRVHQKPHQHYQVHLPTQGTGRSQERRHVRAVCMLGQTQKGRTQTNAIHGRG